MAKRRNAALEVTSHVLAEMTIRHNGSDRVVPIFVPKGFPPKDLARKGDCVQIISIKQIHELEATFVIEET